jgi:hypothetical protein
MEEMHYYQNDRSALVLIFSRERVAQKTSKSGSSPDSFHVFIKHAVKLKNQDEGR